jgi:hypothetical protein
LRPINQLTSSPIHHSVFGCGGRDRTFISCLTGRRAAIPPHRNISKSGAAGRSRTCTGLLTRKARARHAAANSYVLHLGPLAGVEPAWASLQERPVTLTPRHFFRHTSEPLEGIEPSLAPYRGAVRTIHTAAAILGRKTGIEPAPRAWHARAQPLSCIRIKLLCSSLPDY